MEKLLTKVQQHSNWRQDLKKSCRRNKVSIVIASSLNPVKIRSLYERFKKIYSSFDKNRSKSWVQNQLKTLYWILVSISFLHQKLIADFDQDQLSIISQIFWTKDRKLLQYETVRLINEKKTQNVSWSKEENQIFLDVMKTNLNNNKWNNIARQLYEASNGKFFRSGKQCRERWNNHLDPSKNHGDWSQSEDFLILKFIFLGGKKWSQIARILGKRTQHMVKNRFKSLVIRYKKQLGKNTNQNAIIQYALQNTKQQISPQQNQKLKELQQAYSQKTLMLRNRTPSKQSIIEQKQIILQKKNQSSNSLKLLLIINEHESQSENHYKRNSQIIEQDDPVSAFNNGIQNSIIKQITENKNNQENNDKYGNYMNLQMINSPAMWHLRSQNLINTPGLFNFSPSSPLVNTFSQFQKCMDYKWIQDDFHKSTTN